ncbi:phosphopantetheine-binding protein, partial [Embleya sp. NPDC059267]|uniref:phosphopantetheine-binding protein n=1 Tax=Embleya sp. NPDC059267 TaxID=3346798 RepID=UPI0036821F19
TRPSASRTTKPPTETANLLTPAPSPLLRELLGTPADSVGSVDADTSQAEDIALARRVAALPPADAEAVLLDAVRAQTAIVLGHAGTGRVGPDAAFKDLGIDSLMALELRNRLAEATGLKLPATLAFDQPNPSTLARFLSAALAPDSGADPEPAAERLTREIEGLGARLADAFDGLAAPDRTAIATLLGELQGRVRAMASDASPVGIVDRIGSASAGELLALLDKELG